MIGYQMIKRQIIRYSIESISETLWIILSSAILYGEYTDDKPNTFMLHICLALCILVWLLITTNNTCNTLLLKLYQEKEQLIDRSNFVG